MKRCFTQKEIYDYLLANPLNVKVHFGDLEDMQGDDYIFIDYAWDEEISRDNDAYYQQILEISVLTKDYEDRKTLVNYIHQKFLSQVTYSKSDEHEYYQAQMNIGVFVYE